MSNWNVKRLVKLGRSGSNWNKLEFQPTSKFREKLGQTGMLSVQNLNIHQVLSLTRYGIEKYYPDAIFVSMNFLAEHQNCNFAKSMSIQSHFSISFNFFFSPSPLALDHPFMLKLHVV